MTRDITEHGHPAYFLAENGKPYGIRQVDGKPEISTTPHAFDIAMGKVRGKGAIRVAGHNGDVGPTLETVWSAGGLYPWPVAAEILKISSSDPDDDGILSGSGAYTLELIGYDADYVPQSEIVILTGTTPVSTANEYLRVYKARVLSAGATGGNEGRISVKDNSNTTALLVIEPSRNESLMAVFTIPKDMTGHIVSWSAATSSIKVVNAELYVRPFGQVFQCKTFVEINQIPYKEPWEFPETINEKSDIELRAATFVGGGAVSGGFSLWFELNSSGDS